MARHTQISLTKTQEKKVDILFAIFDFLVYILGHSMRLITRGKKEWVFGGAEQRILLI